MEFTVGILISTMGILDSTAGILNSILVILDHITRNLISIMGILDSVVGILRRIRWLELFGKFEANNVDLTRVFSQSFEGEFS